MKFTEKRKLGLLMTLHTLWGLILWLSISKYGLGISTDSVHLLFGSLNLAEGRGLFSFDGSFLTLWPPLYPILLAFIHILSGWNTFVSASALQIISFAGISFCLSLMFMRIFPDNYWLALAANILSDIGVVVLTSFNIVGSDYVHFLFVAVFFLVAGYYIERKTPFLLLMMSLVGMLAMLQRYLGIAVIATGVAVVFLFNNSGIKQRLSHSLLVAISALPASVWFFITSRLISRRAPISFAENLTWFSRSILEWFFPTEALQPHLFLYMVALWVILIGMVVMMILLSRGCKSLSIFAFPVFVYGLIYLLALFASASLTYFNKLGGRFLLPLYIPCVVLLVSAWHILFERVRRLESKFLRRVMAIGLIGVLAVVALGLLHVTAPVILDAYSNGAVGENAFNNRAWRKNSVIQYWLANQPRGGYLLFSNYPDGVSFYTWHPSQNSPAQYSGSYGKEEIPLTQYIPRLFASGLPVYLIWIEPNEYSYYYTPEELDPIADIKPLFISQDGGVYCLMPKQDSAP